MSDQKEVILDQDSKNAKTIELNAKNTDKLKALVQQQLVAQQLVQECVFTILDTKDVNYANKQVKWTEDFTKIIVSDK